MSPIVGLGFDATDIDRVAATLARYGDRFRQRIFTSGEIAYCMRRRAPAIHFAGRFAAKEAAMKALGTGHSHGVLWRDRWCAMGPPQLRLRRRGPALRSHRRTLVLLTITHSSASQWPRSSFWATSARSPMPAPQAGWLSVPGHRRRPREPQLHLPCDYGARAPAVTRHRA